MIKLAICSATLGQPQPSSQTEKCLLSQLFNEDQWLGEKRWKEGWLDDGEITWLLRINTPEDNLGVTGSLQELLEASVGELVAFLHSDLLLHDQNWIQRVLGEFDDPKVGVVGFGGATQLGSDDLYKTPYKLQQLARFNFLSNMDEAEKHGKRFEGACDVATLDGFALIVRRTLLDKWWHPESTGKWRGFGNRGWPVDRYPFHNYDNALCIEAARQGYRVRLVGVKCHHFGGTTSTMPEAQDFWLKSLGKTDREIHEESHLRLFEDGRGILPLKVKEDGK